MSRRKKLPVEALEAEIESLSHEGRGVSRIDGKTVFIDGALPGEKVSFYYRRGHRKYAEGVLDRVLEHESALRVEPGCKHFLVCGGCSLQHLEPAEQIRHKENVLQEQLQHIGGVTAGRILEPLTGPLWGYRRKARLGVRYVIKKEKVLVGFREKYKNFIADIESCAVLHPFTGTKLTALADLVAGLGIYNKIAQIEVAMDERDTVLVFRNLATPSTDDISLLEEFAKQHAVKIYLQPGGPDTVVPLNDSMATGLYYDIDDGKVRIHFAATDFTQVNFEINRQMIDRVTELLNVQEKDRIIDLFCGLGNFTLPLARRCASVTGLEGSDALVEKALFNAKANAIENVSFHRTDLFNEETGRQPADWGYNKILLDPPRSGAQNVASNWPMPGVEKLVYVSCNPATLARDAGILVNKKGFRLAAAGIMDMFPHTAHVESVAVFERD